MSGSITLEASFYRSTHRAAARLARTTVFKHFSRIHEVLRARPAGSGEPQFWPARPRVPNFWRDPTSRSPLDNAEPSIMGSRSIRSGDVTQVPIAAFSPPDHPPRGIDLGPWPTVPGGSRWDELAGHAGRIDGNAEAAIDLARAIGGRLPLPGHGDTAERWAALATLAAIDLTAARVAEAHLDALAILAEAGIQPGRDLSELGAGPDSTWGVFAAEGPAVHLQAHESGPMQNGWLLDGTKPWCSLAGRLSHALITAHTSVGHRRLFAVALQTGTVEVARGAWVSRGLTAVESGPIEMHRAVGVPIGADRWDAPVDYVGSSGSVR